jgi:DNA (cytosine-5)-methyltransferase 1
VGTDRRPRLLDLFCGAGGAAMGYHRAGFEVVGVDINPQPHYPFEFHQADAFDALRAVAERDPFWLGRFDAIHASPPCQAYSSLRRIHPGNEYPELIPVVIDRLDCWGGPYVVENVPTRALGAQLMLCGTMFGLGVEGRRLYRHRYFRLNWAGPLGPADCCHDLPSIQVTGTGNGGSRQPTTHAQLREAMGIDWMSRPELSQAIPPAYTEWIGSQLMEAIMTTYQHEDRTGKLRAVQLPIAFTATALTADQKRWEREVGSQYVRCPKCPMTVRDLEGHLSRAHPVTEEPTFSSLWQDHPTHT